MSNVVTRPSRPRGISKATMSDRSILMSVEDLIYTAFGHPQENKVDFKMLQSIFQILARQMRLLEQTVEIKIDDIITEYAHAEEAGSDDESGTYSSSSEEEDEDDQWAERGRQHERREGKDRARKEEKGDKKDRRDERKRDEKDEKAEKGSRKGKRGTGEKEDGKASSKGREGKASSEDREGKASSKHREGKSSSEDREDKASSKYREGKDSSENREGKASSKDREGKASSKDREGKASLKDREGKASSEDQEGKASSKYREGKASSENREGKASSKDREGKASSKDREGKASLKDREGKAYSEDREGKASSKYREGKASSKDREGKSSSKDREGKASSKDREGKASSKDQEGKGHSKDRDGKDKRSKGRDKHSRDKDGRGGRGGEHEHRNAHGKRREGRDFGRQTSGTSISVSEGTRMGSGGSADTVLIAESGPAARVRPARIGSIEVVTTSQFALLGKAVKQLQQITGPLPEPVLPDNETLRQDLATGRASLQDTMVAVQLNARVQAAEQGLYRMAELLTQLAQSGILPPKLASQVGAIGDYLEAAKAAGHAGGIRTRSTVSRMDSKKSTATEEETESQVETYVTHTELFEVVNQMKDEISKKINTLTARADHTANVASITSTRIADKVHIATHVGGRINTLLQLTEDYAAKVRGFDSGLMLQMNNFQAQVVSMRNDLAAGLALLDISNDNARTAALLDLKEHNEGLVFELENTIQLHQEVNIAQLQINEEIMSLQKCVELLREQKSDRAEVIDILNDKADLTRLIGLLCEQDFAIACAKIENRLAKCYDMFNRQDTRWRGALSELMDIANNKAVIIMLMSLRENTDTGINDIQMLLKKLEIMLGEPKAAVLMRKLAKDASCGACLTRALMEPVDPTYGKPLPLPALRPPPLGAEQQPCYREPKLVPPDIRDHICRRWVGGSHTLMARNIAKVKSQPMKLQIIPTKKFEGYGFDGKTFMMEEDMPPCAECNQLSTDEAAPVSPHCPTSTGGGDQASAPTRR